MPVNKIGFGVNPGQGGLPLGGFGAVPGVINGIVTPVTIAPLTAHPLPYNVILNATLGTITAQESGMYVVFCNGSYSIAEPSSLLTAVLYINGSPVLNVTPGFQRSISNSAAYGSSSFAAPIYLAATDVLEVKVTAVGNATITFSYFNFSVLGTNNPIGPSFIHDDMLNIMGGDTEFNHLGVCEYDLLAPLGTGVSKTVAQSIPTGVVTAVNWDQADFEDAGSWDIGTPDRIITPAVGVGDKLYVQVSAVAQFASSGTATTRILDIQIGLVIRAEISSPANALAGSATALNITTGWLEVGNPGTHYIRLRVTQSSGGSINLNAARTNMVANFRVQRT